MILAIGKVHPSCADCRARTTMVWLDRLAELEEREMQEDPVYLATKRLKDLVDHSDDVRISAGTVDGLPVYRVQALVHGKTVPIRVQSEKMLTAIMLACDQAGVALRSRPVPPGAA